MKKQNNRDKLNDALGMVDEVTVQNALTHAEVMKAARAAQITRRATLRRRFAVMAAACLALAMMAGAILAVPLLTADDPAGTQPPITVTTEEGVPFYVEAPLVKIGRLSATETAEITAPSIPTEDLSTQVSNLDDSFAYFSFLTVDCEPGETVTLTADTDCMAVIDMNYDTVLVTDLFPDIELNLWHYAHRREHPIYYSTQNGPVEYTYFENTATFDPATSCVYLNLRPTNTDLDKTVISFTVRNAEGQITGAASVCVARYYMLSVDERGRTLTILNPTVTRAAVLGSVRITDPTTVTEEQVTALIGEFEAGAEAAFASMDFSPATDFEARYAIYGEIISTVLAEEESIRGGHACIRGVDDYSFFGTRHEDGRDREFIIFGDGTWTEIQPYDTDEKCILSQCHADPNCPVTAEKGLHHPLWPGCHMTAKDGRVYELVRGDWENGILGTAKLIYDPNA